MSSCLFTCLFGFLVVCRSRRVYQKRSLDFWWIYQTGLIKGTIEDQKLKKNYSQDLVISLFDYRLFWNYPTFGNKHEVWSSSFQESWKCTRFCPFTCKSNKNQGN